MIPPNTTFMITITIPTASTGSKSKTTVGIIFESPYNVLVVIVNKGFATYFCYVYIIKKINIIF